MLSTVKSESFKPIRNSQQNEEFKSKFELNSRWTKQIVIKTCRDRGGVDYEVSYIDTACDNPLSHHDVNQKTALLIHGNPGKNTHFKLQILHLAKQNIRVIAPLFPEYRFTHISNGKYHHSTTDRYKYICDFLTALNISKIDLLVSHSGGIYPTLKMILKNADEIGCLAILNPGPHIPIEFTTPNWLRKVAVYSGFYKLTYYLMKKSTFFVLKLLSPIRIKDFDDILIGLAAVPLNFTKVHEMIENWRQTKIPTLIVYSGNDELIDINVYRDLLKRLRVPEKQVLVYDDQSHLKNSDSIEDIGDWIKVIMFENGTHCPMQKHSQIVNEALSELLTRSKL